MKRGKWQPCRKIRYCTAFVYRNRTTGDVYKRQKYGSMEYRKAFMRYVCRGAAIPAEYRADAVSSTTDVGATIPTTVLNQIVQKLESTGMILALVTRTAYKGGVAIPVSTVKPTATWVAEGKGSEKQKFTATKDGMITFAYHKLRCAVAVSLEVDTMAISAFEAMLINNIVEAMTKMCIRDRLYSDDLTYEQKIYLIYFRYA